VTSRRDAALLALGVLSPLAVAAIALATRPWVPVLDMAMTELRVRDVGGRHTPLVGLPGRIGRTIREQGSHPGPWSFYLVAPFYRLSGSRAWGMELASCILNAACVAGAVAIGRRRFGGRGALLGAVLAAVAVRGYGPNVLTHPWNPYFPVLLWLLALLAAWLVLDGWHSRAVAVVALTSVAAQTHLPYLPNALVLDALVLGVLAWRVRRGVAPWRPLAVAVGVGAVLWIPPLVEQLVRSPGNIGKLVRHFTTEQPEPAIGVGHATKLVLQHLDWFAMAVDLVRRKDAFVHRAGVAGDPGAGVSIGGLIVVALWGAAAVWAWRRRHRTLLALHAVIAVTLLSGLLSSARIFGKVWFYLTLWMSSTALLVAVSLAATAWVLAVEHADRLPRARWLALDTLAAVTVTFATAGSIVTAVGQEPPEQGQGEAVHAVLPELAAALDPSARYVVFWQESVVPGSQGYAVFSELERRGLAVGVHPTWRVPATPHRVFPPGSYDGEVHVISGGWIARWPGIHPEAEQLLVHDHRTAAERDRFDQLDARVVARLTALGRTDLLDTVDTNLFGASLDPALPADLVADLSEMLLIGEPLAIFLGPPGSTN
jgi:hypothetical protein